MAVVRDTQNRSNEISEESTILHKVEEEQQELKEKVRGRKTSQGAKAFGQ